MITQKLKKAVVKEALLLRKHATKEEKDKLNIKTISCDIKNCTYGQMTGSCYSDRAFELLKKCAKPWAKRCWEGGDISDQRSYTNIRRHDGRHFSAIEVYLSLADAKNETLIKLIKS